MLNEKTRDYLKSLWYKITSKFYDYSAYGRLNKAQKVELAAKLQATEFLTLIGDTETYHDGTFVVDKTGKKITLPLEQLPVLSDVNAERLKDLLVKFYNRQIKL